MCTHTHSFTKETVTLLFDMVSTDIESVERNWLDMFVVYFLWMNKDSLLKGSIIWGRIRLGRGWLGVLVWVLILNRIVG